MSPVKVDQLDNVLATVKKRFNGAETIRAGNETPDVYRIPWDSLELNLATFGGAAMGRMIRLWGGFSSCKSLSALGLAKQAQQHRSEAFPNGLTVAYYDVEGTFHSGFARDKMGVNIDKPHFMVVEGSIIEDIVRKAEQLMGAIHIHIIDTASYAQSVHSYSKNKDSRQPGFNSQAWGDGLKALEESMDKRENMIVIIDQERVDFKTGGSKAAGGKVIDHAASQSLKFRQAKALYRNAAGELTDTRPKEGNDELTGTHRKDGYIVEVEVVKSKVCRPFGKANMKFDVDNASFDRFFELQKAAIFLGVVEQAGSYYKVQGESKAMHGEKQFAARLAEDTGLVMQIYSAAAKYCRDGLNYAA